MHLFFGDDSRQNCPTRSKMGPRVAAGGFLVDGKAVKSLEASLGNVCQKAGFPVNDEFKWSPGRELWMRINLVGDARRDFFFNVLSAAADHEIVAMAVLEDAKCRTAPRAQTHEDDVSRLLLERVHNALPFSSVRSTRWQISRAGAETRGRSVVHVQHAGVHGLGAAVSVPGGART